MTLLLQTVLNAEAVMRVLLSLANVFCLSEEAEMYHMFSSFGRGHHWSLSVIGCSPTGASIGHALSDSGRGPVGRQEGAVTCKMVAMPTGAVQPNQLTSAVNR